MSRIFKFGIMICLNILSDQLVAQNFAYLDVGGPLNMRENAYTMNKAGNGWLAWSIRNTSLAESKMDLVNLNNVYLEGSLGLGTVTPAERLQVGSPFTTLQNNIALWTNGNAGGEQSKFMFKMAVGGGVGNSTIAEIVPFTFAPGFQGQVNRLDFKVGDWNNMNNAGSAKLSILSNGNVGIGTTNPGGFKLAVEGKIGAREINVTTNSPWPDYVFEPTYTLPSLDSVESYINQNNHLPEVPSAKEMEANGVNLGEMNMLLLKKVEELTLYLITQQEQLRLQQLEINNLKSKIK